MEDGLGDELAVVVLHQVLEGEGGGVQVAHLEPLGDGQPAFVLDAVDHCPHLDVVVLCAEVVEGFEWLLELCEYILYPLLLVEFLEHLLVPLPLLELLLILLYFPLGLLPYGLLLLLLLLFPRFLILLLLLLHLLHVLLVLFELLVLLLLHLLHGLLPYVTFFLALFLLFPSLLG